MRRRRLAVTCSALLAAAALDACRRDGAHAPADIARPRDAAPATAAPAAFDAGALAGVFEAPGLRLRLDAGGRYRLRVHAESAAADLESGGSWRMWADGRHLILTPTDGSEPTRRYTLPTVDELQPDDGGTPLHRAGTR